MTNLKRSFPQVKNARVYFLVTWGIRVERVELITHVENLSIMS